MDLVRLQAQQVDPALETDLPGARPQQAEQRLDDGGLARAVGTENDTQLARLDRQRYPIDGRYRSVRHGQIRDLEQVAHSSDPRYASMTLGLARISAEVPSAIFSPKLMTTTRSETAITTCMLCSIRSRVTPASRKRAIKLITPWASCATMPAVGSSRINRRGSTASARAISTRRWSPYGSSLAIRKRFSPTPTQSRSDSACSIVDWRSLRSRRVQPIASQRQARVRTVRPTITFSSALRCWNSRMF